MSIYSNVQITGKMGEPRFFADGKGNVFVTVEQNNVQVTLEPEHIRALAAALFAYEVAKKPDAARIAELKAKWSSICEAMNKGSYPGTEADALARIDRIKDEIAKLEAEQ